MRVVTHERPHLDEIAAWWLLYWFGEKKFPGIRSATFETCSGNYPRESREVILLGVGGGRFDEHAVDGQERKEGCAATLVAEFLNIDGSPELGEILDFVERVDTQGGNSFDWNDLVRVLYDAKPDNVSDEEYLEKVADTMFLCLSAKYTQQRKFHRNAGVFKQTARVRVLANGVRLVSFTGNLEMAASIARSTHGVSADVVVLKNRDGIQVLTNHKNILVRERIDQVAAMLRAAEQMAAGRIRVTDMQKLASDGKLPEVLEWYYHKAGRSVFNGSLTQKAPPTRLTLTQIIAIVEKAMTHQTTTANHTPRPRPQSRPRTRATA